MPCEFGTFGWLCKGVVGRSEVRLPRLGLHIKSDDKFRNIPGSNILSAYQTMAGLSPGMPLAAEAAITTQTVLTIMLYWFRNPASNIISQCALPAALWIIYKVG